VAHSGFDLALRDGSSLLLLRNGIDGILLQGQFVDAGSSISGGTFSRGRWRKIVEEEERQLRLARDERERERARRIAAKKKAKADAEIARKAKVAADHAALTAQVASIIGGSQAEAVRAAYAMSRTLENLRLGTLAANSARQREETRKAQEPKPKPSPLELVRDLLKRVRIEDVAKPDVIREIMKLDLVSDIMKHDLVGNVMKSNKEKYGLK
jgi:hypothetical protein